MADALRIHPKTAEPILERSVAYRARLNADDRQALADTPQTGLNRERIKTRGSEVAEDLAGHLEFLGARGAPNAFERGQV